MSEFDRYWPHWPGGHASTLVLVDAQVKVDDLFILLFGPNSKFQVRFEGRACRANSRGLVPREPLPERPTPVSHRTLYAFAINSILLHLRGFPGGLTCASDAHARVLSAWSAETPRLFNTSP